MIKKLSQEEFSNSEYFDICADLYEEKYFFEEFNLDDLSNLTFFIFILNGEIIGFGSHQVSEYMNVVETLFSEGHQYSDYHSELLQFILNDIKDLETSTYAHQSIQSDYEFYLKNGFKLWKDYGESIQLIGQDTMRWSLILDKQS